MRSAVLLAALLFLLLSACGQEDPAGPRQLDLIPFELDDSVFSDDFRLITLYHPKLSVAKIIEIYRADRGTYVPVDRSSITIEEGKLVIRDPERAWRTLKLQCPFVQIVVAVLP
jgi:hypothetical protein